MIPIQVEDQEFVFPSGWQVFKFDDHPYRKRLLGDARAVDLVALDPHQVLHLIEVKNFRGHGPENRRRITHGELYREISEKVRATVAGIIGGHRCRHAGFQPLASALVDVERRIKVVAWIEHDYDERDRGHGALLTGEELLKKHVRWLEARVLLGNSYRPDVLHGVVVRNLARPPG